MYLFVGYLLEVLFTPQNYLWGEKNATTSFSNCGYCSWKHSN